MVGKERESRMTCKSEGRQLTDVDVGELHGSWEFSHTRFMLTVLSTEVGILSSRVSSLVRRPHKQVVAV